MKSQTCSRLFISPFLLLLFISGCKKQVLTSQIPENPLVIDGLNSEWNSNLIVDEKTKVSYAVQNDTKNLYLLLMTDDISTQHRLLMTGLVLWLDEQGDGVKEAGVKFPRGLMERELPAGDFFRSLHDRSGKFDEERFQAFTKEWCRDVQIVDHKSNNLGIFTHREAEQMGIQFQLGLHDNKMIYELCLPLEISGRVQWHFAPQITLGIETPQMQFSGMRPMRPTSSADAGGSPGGSPGGGRGGRGGGRGGGAIPEGNAETELAGAGQGGGGRGMNSEPIKLSMDVILAK
ncbi:MAG: hypothetical protein EHM72_05925 [Calditrichaeota bacterium]|nr:MAG: hypothetical protein EHM72_05925 [Calditrichota bacterium]